MTSRFVKHRVHVGDYANIYYPKTGETFAYEVISKMNGITVKQLDGSNKTLLLEPIDNDWQIVGFGEPHFIDFVPAHPRYHPVAEIYPREPKII